MAKYIKPTERILNCIPSVNVEKDWEFKHAIDAELLAAPAALPSSLDLRENWWDIGDQLDHGACVGFATADSLMRWHFVKKNMLPATKGYALSVRFIFMAAKEIDENPTPATFLEEAGTSLKAGLDVARRYGCATESNLPFEPIKLYHGLPQTFYTEASKFKIANYFNLRKPRDDWGAVKNSWRTWLATTGPVMTRLGVDATWDDADKTNGNLDVYKPNTVRGGHAIALVGYTSDRFIVRNSWGVSWGDKGFGYASEEYAKAAFTEAYGITV